jgi:hypothetical protein
MGVPGRSQLEIRTARCHDAGYKSGQPRRRQPDARSDTGQVAERRASVIARGRSQTGASQSGGSQTGASQSGGSHSGASQGGGSRSGASQGGGSHGGQPEGGEPRSASQAGG